MSSKEIDDYLTKQIFIEKNIVTFRSLSRVFFIHVNAAKNALEEFYAKPEKGFPCTATYTLSGELNPPEYIVADEDFKMEVDSYGISDVQDEENMDIELDSDEPLRTAFMLVSEADLEVQMSRFADIYEQTIHCLSPSPIHDANAICPLTEDVKKVDYTQKGVDNYKTFGRVVAKGIKVRVPKPPRPLPDVPKLPVLMQRAREERARREKAEAAIKQEAEQKGKPAGKIDFPSKAKTAKDKAAVSKAPPVKTEPTMHFFGPTKSTEKRAEPPSKEKQVAKASTPAAEKGGKDKEKATVAEPKRGIKRKSIAGVDPDDSTTDDSKPMPKASSSKPTGARVQRGVIVSDDEDDDVVVPPLRTGFRKGRVSSTASSVPDSEPPSDSEPDSEAERELRAMMDVEDDKVERVSRPRAIKPSTSEEDENDDDASQPEVQDEDVEMDDADDVPKPKPKPRKSRKVPIGSNGLKKKRVIKSRKTVDAKGYMATEDYSEWESVDEADPPPAKKQKGKQPAPSKDDPAGDKPAPNTKPEGDKGSEAKATTTKQSDSTKTTRKIQVQQATLKAWME
ncbi:hypothetical protein ONZ45_g6377 [Pleurotus djamor]|nr:hypothetical protein ONZ45_g6377 [Pleurotus djamor]